jgi:hypothetical protein
MRYLLLAVELKHIKAEERDLVALSAFLWGDNSQPVNGHVHNNVAYTPTFCFCFCFSLYTKEQMSTAGTRNWKIRRNRFLKKIRQLLSSYCRCRGPHGPVCRLLCKDRKSRGIELAESGWHRPPAGQQVHEKIAAVVWVHWWAQLGAERRRKEKGPDAIAY